MRPLRFSINVTLDGCCDHRAIAPDEDLFRNAIENLNGTLRRVIRNVKRWQGETMIKRWVALGIAEAQRGFRRVKGHGQMNVLLSALCPNPSAVGQESKVA